MAKKQTIPEGLHYRALDLHVHTPASKDYKDKGVSAEDIVAAAIDKGLSGICITDHNTVEWVDKVSETAKGKPLTVFPGFEISVTGGKEGPVHIIGVFDPTRTAEELNDVLSDLQLTAAKRGKRQAEHTAGIWRAGRIRNMLRNTAYMGDWEYGKRSKKRRLRKRIKGYCPPIVSKETFRQADSVLKSNRWEMPHQKRRKYLLRGVIKCDDCGQTYSSAAYKSGGIYRRYYKCTGAGQWRKLGRPKCHSKSIRAEAIEEVVWSDIKAFVKTPDLAIQQLRANRKPFDFDLKDKLSNVEGQIQELHRRERNLLRVAAESQEVDVDALDDVLAEVRTSLVSLDDYRKRVAKQLENAENQDAELCQIARRLSSLLARVENASFEERRRAVEELVKSIDVVTQEVGGRKTSVATITYRFDEPQSPKIPPTSSPLPVNKTTRLGL